MILGSIQITPTSLITHRDSFMLANLTVISVRRPFLAGSVLLTCALGGFTAAFHDLLTLNEMITLIVICTLMLLVAFNTGQLSLLSRDLKNTELSSAVWGHPTALNKARHQIVTARESSSLTHTKEHTHANN